MSRAAQKVQRSITVPGPGITWGTARTAPVVSAFGGSEPAIQSGTPRALIAMPVERDDQKEAEPRVGAVVVRVGVGAL